MSSTFYGNLVIWRFKHSDQIEIIFGFYIRLPFIALYCENPITHSPTHSEEGGRRGGKEEGKEGGKEGREGGEGRRGEHTHPLTQYLILAALHLVHTIKGDTSHLHERLSQESCISLHTRCQEPKPCSGTLSLLQTEHRLHCQFTKMSPVEQTNRRHFDHWDR